MSKAVTELEIYLVNCKSILHKFEETCGFNSPQNEINFTTCPLNFHHRVPAKSIQRHLNKCEWRKFGYSKAEVKQIVGVENTTSSENQPVGLVNQDQIISSIIPSKYPIRSESRYKSELTPEVRLKIYEKIKETTNTSTNVPEAMLYMDLEAALKEKIKAENENLSELQIQQKLRDAKRRRQSYKNKNVHTANRSQTEIMRELISIHMDELKSNLKVHEDVQKDLSKKLNYYNKDDDIACTSSIHKAMTKSEHHKRKHSEDEFKTRTKRQKEKEKNSYLRKSHKHDR